VSMRIERRNWIGETRRSGGTSLSEHTYLPSAPTSNMLRIII
jgi:hypothetical protein